MEQSELESLKDFAVVLARETGAIQQRHFGSPNEIEYKGSVDLVTSVDRQCESVITGRIRDRFPDHNMVSEESENPLTRSPFRWYVDPLDGTTNYVHGYPCFSVAIALEVQGEMAVGVVYDPVRDEMFHGTKGHGAFLNGGRIRVSLTQDLDHSLLATGFPYDIRRSRENNIDHFTQFSLVSQGVRQDGSAALDLCYVAMGRFDGFWEMKLAPWDLAAGTLVVQEAGGRVSSFGGGYFRIESGEVLASNGWIHGEMISVLCDGKTESARYAS